MGGVFSSKREEGANGPESPNAYRAADSSAQSIPHTSLESRQEIPISNELMAKHEDSQHRYPRVHLSKGEYVIMEVRRHPIGLVSILFLVLLMVAAVLVLIPYYTMNREAIASTFKIGLDSLPTGADVTMPLLGVAALFLLGGFLAVYVYVNNLFYLTNESIMQYIQTSIFSTKEQQINLVNVDDVSYRQEGILQQVLNYGTLRVSTEGDERNPYVFPFVARPQMVTRTINDAMEEATGFAVRYRRHRDTLADSTLPPPEKF
jgi:hypothetical protein